MLDVAAIVVSLTALLAYLNHRLLRLPAAIGVMVLALLVSLLIQAAGLLGLERFERAAEALIAGIDFYDLLMHGMLSMLLFAGALHVDLSALADRRWEIGVMCCWTRWVRRCPSLTACCSAP